MMNLFN